MYFSSSECIIWVTVFAAEFLAIVIVNLLSIIVFIKNKSLRTRRMYLVISLTVADILAGGLSGSVFLFKVPAWKSCDFEEVYPVVPLISLTNITVISLERMHATFRPLRHRLVKRWVYMVAIAVVWVFPGIAAGLEKERKILKICVNFLWEAHSILCLFVVFASYTSIFLKFRFRAHPQRHFGANLRQKKLTVTLFITTLVSLLMWLPYNIFKFLSITSNGISHSTTRLLNADLFFVLLFFANSLVNPILYTVRMPEFKKALFSLFRRQQRQNVAIPPHWY